MSIEEGLEKLAQGLDKLGTQLELCIQEMQGYQKAAEPITKEVEEAPEDEREVLKGKLREMGVEFSERSRLKTLQGLYDEACKKQEPTKEVEAPTKEVEATEEPGDELLRKCRLALAKLIKASDKNAAVKVLVKHGADKDNPMLSQLSAEKVQAVIDEIEGVDDEKIFA